MGGLRRQDPRGDGRQGHRRRPALGRDGHPRVDDQDVAAMRGRPVGGQAGVGLLGARRERRLGAGAQGDAVRDDVDIAAAAFLALAVLMVPLAVRIAARIAGFE